MQTTLLLIIKDNKILLPQKKRGFGAGLYNGVGGKVNENENIEQAMLRETLEEIGVTPINYKKVGFTIFDEIYKGSPVQIEMTTFVASNYIGEIQESEEVKPCWFDINNLPFNNMMPDDIYWYPILLKGKNFEAYFKINKDNKIEKYTITEI